MKECIACAEEIKSGANLCRFCGTLQNDPRFLDAADSAPDIGQRMETIKVWLRSQFECFRADTGFMPETSFIPAANADLAELYQAGESYVWTLNFYDFGLTYVIPGFGAVTGSGFAWIKGCFENDEDIKGVDGYFLSAKESKGHDIVPVTFCWDCDWCHGIGRKPALTNNVCPYCEGSGIWEFSSL